MSTQRVSIREARQRLRHLLDRVEAGDEVVVLRRGVEVGDSSGPSERENPYPDLGAFRASIKIQGQPLSQDIAEGRRSSRY